MLRERGSKAWEPGWDGVIETGVRVRGTVCGGVGN